MVTAVHLQHLGELLEEEKEEEVEAEKEEEEEKEEEVEAEAEVDLSEVPEVGGFGERSNCRRAEGDG